MYSPRLAEDLIRRLYLICQPLEIPMTALVNGALVRAEESVVVGGK